MGRNLLPILENGIAGVEKMVRLRKKGGTKHAGDEERNDYGYKDKGRCVIARVRPF